jgi:hypothetical protein
MCQFDLQSGRRRRWPGVFTLGAAAAVTIPAFAADEDESMQLTSTSPIRA